MKGIPRTLLALLVSALLTACGGGGSGKAPALTIEGAWARAMPLISSEGQPGTNSAVYLTLRNKGPAKDRLLGGSTPAAGGLEVHESRLVDDVMRMRKLEELEVPGGGSVELRPGGKHIMLLDLGQSLVEGDQITITLRFELSGERTIQVPVRASGS